MIKTEKVQDVKSTQKKRIIISMFVVAICLSSCVSVTSQTILIDPSEENEPLTSLNEAHLWLGCNNDDLYSLSLLAPSPMLRYENWLCRVEPGKLKKVAKLSVARQMSHDRIWLAGQIGSDLYYFTTADDMQSLYVMDMDTGKTEIVWISQQDQFISRNDIRIEDDILWLRLLENGMGNDSYGIQGDYLFVQNRKAQVFNDRIMPYQIGAKEYVLDFELGESPKLFFREKNCEWQDTGLKCGVNCSLFPTQYGLIVYNRGYANGDKQSLYLIAPNGEAVELLTFRCLYSDSAINLYHDKLYYSVKRYEKYGSLGMTRYEDDEFEGTYIISLTDMSIEKGSDMIFDGLYIFDDTGIFACDENCNIYKLDFDGYVIDTILEVKGS